MGTAMPDRRAGPCGLGAEDVWYTLLFRAAGRRRQAAARRPVDGPHALKWRNGFSPGVTFEGAFSNVIRSYAGKGIVRNVW
jgi:hypothetical protein